MTSALPAAKDLDVGALSRVFDNTTNAYKLLFFQALLNLFLTNYRPNQPARFLLDDLAVEMAAIAWYPYSFFHLSFGVQDKTSEILDALQFSVNEAALGNPSTQALLRQAIRDQSGTTQVSRVLRYAPYRLLQPFFQAELAGRPDHTKEAVTKTLSNETFLTRKPLYRLLESDIPSLEFHPQWAEYIYRSFPLVKGWVTYKWIDYLHTRNPNMPAIPNKLAPPVTRSALTAQTDYWRTVMTVAPLKCIYSQTPLDEKNFCLDHFLPWSFVCHDQLWNLIPVSPSANSAKSNRLPADEYVSCFIDRQCAALKTAHSVLKTNIWTKHTESFVGDLRIPKAGLLDNESVRAAYLGTLPAMISLAERTGFASGWTYINN